MSRIYSLYNLMNLYAGLEIGMAGCGLSSHGADIHGVATQNS